MPGLLRGVARTAVVAGTATVVSNRVSRRQGQRWAAQDQQGADQQQADEEPAAAAVPEQAPSPEASGGDDMDAKLAQLKQLGELKSAGVLSEDEFAAQKQQILGS
jgi:Short C-terminal domain